MSSKPPSVSPLCQAVIFPFNLAREDLARRLSGSDAQVLERIRACVENPHIRKIIEDLDSLNHPNLRVTNRWKPLLSSKVDSPSEVGHLFIAPHQRRKSVCMFLFSAHVILWSQNGRCGMQFNDIWNQMVENVFDEDVPGRGLLNKYFAREFGLLFKKVGVTRP